MRRIFLVFALLALPGCGGDSWRMQKPDIDLELPKASDLDGPGDGPASTARASADDDCTLIRQMAARPNGCSAACPCASGELCCSAGDDPMGMCVKGSCSSR